MWGVNGDLKIRHILLGIFVNFLLVNQKNVQRMLQHPKLKHPQTYFLLLWHLNMNFVQI